MKNNKMTKDTVPEGFSVVMALVDLIPVVFFGLSAVRGGGGCFRVRSLSPERSSACSPAS